jgi:hypothetical protein
MKPKIKIRKKKGWRGGDNAKEKSLQTIVTMKDARPTPN